MISTADFLNQTVNRKALISEQQQGQVIQVKTQVMIQTLNKSHQRSVDVYIVDK